MPVGDVLVERDGRGADAADGLTVGEEVDRLPEGDDGQVVECNLVDLLQSGTGLLPVFGLIDILQGKAHRRTAMAGVAARTEEPPGIDDRFPEGEFCVAQVVVVGVQSVFGSQGL